MVNSIINTDTGQIDCSMTDRIAVQAMEGVIVHVIEQLKKDLSQVESFGQTDVPLHSQIFVK